MASQPQSSDPITGLKPSENCAVVGYYGTSDSFDKLYVSLRTLQHRGQEASGVAVFDGRRVNLLKVDGYVFEGFKPYIEANQVPHGNVGIGHNRYSTAGQKNLTGAGPFLISTANGDMALAHNGEIVNHNELREELKEKGVPFLTKTDTEVMLNIIAREIKLRGTKSGIRSAMDILKGSYSAILLIQGKMFAMRDPMGFRPLILGKVGNDYVVASESSAIEVLGGTIIRDVDPGEVLEFSDGTYNSIIRVPSPRLAHCMFEWVYFARPDSVMDRREVYESRLKMGMELAKEFPVEADIVIPVPDSGRTQALGYSQQSGIEYSEGLFKNRYSERTFIMPGEANRDVAIKIKLNPIKSVIKDKRIILVDDSIVRGTTMKRIVGILRNAGAKEVHVRIGSPPIIAPCYFGIDMKTRDQFIALNKTPEEVSSLVGADSVAYLSINGLMKSIGMTERELCLGCLTAKYPLKVSGEMEVGQTTLDQA
ncbi:amidophosphoribosyltransferase [Cuniculiplasma sp. SKW3]|uniref:amidophosphoribosyltransferase n=1 Tax=Cuniculiplasma sp. SKW3 TaxID=3400170 RepID=UPI003FD538B3